MNGNSQLSFNDIFKSSFLEKATTFSLLDTAYSTRISLCYWSFYILSI